MSNLFSTVMNMSMTGSVVILLVMLARLILKKAPKIFSYALWSVVLFRLLCPVAFTAPVSVLDVVEPELKETSNNTSIVSFIPASVDTQADFVMVHPKEQPVQLEIVSEQEEQLRMTPMHAVLLVWATGTVGMILYSVAQYLSLRRKLVGSIQLKGNIHLADHIDTAFVVGLLQPKIYLPSSVPSNERYYILAHEQHHIRRFDHVIKLLAYLALCIHWFNPLVWIAFVLAGKDMEMSCDEAVINKLGADIRADYSASLLRLATHKKILSGLPLAFGEGDTKGRVLNMAKWKKPTKWLAAICVILCLCIVSVCAFNPQNNEEATIEEMTRHTSDGPVDTAVGDLCFIYPGGLTSEQRDVDNWTAEDTLRSKRNLPTRRQYSSWFIDNGVDFGGVVDFIVPEDREIRLEEMNLPSEWAGLDYIAGSSTYPYAEMEYTLIKDGKDYIQMYLYTYSGRGYFLWFYTEQGNPAHKQAILESVKLGSFHKRATKLKQDEIVSLGLFNITIPKGYGYYRNESKILEITKKEPFNNNQNVVGCVTALPNPNLTMESDSDMVDWIEAMGIALQKEGVSYSISEESGYGDIYLTIHDVSQGKLVIDDEHYFFISGNVVYDLCFGLGDLDSKVKTAILESIWIKEGSTKAETRLDEIDALNLCKSVLNTIQNGSYHIAWHKSRTGPGSDSRYSVAYFSHDENWMHITYLNVGSDDMETQLRMKVNGKIFYDVESPVKENIRWSDGDVSNPDLPWLTYYKWDDNKIVFKGIHQSYDQKTIRLQINEPFYGFPEESKNYFVTFFFDGSGNFIQVELQADAIRNNGVWKAGETESVISLDPEKVNAEIQKEYQNAIG